jgi:hypothetical protein
MISTAYKIGLLMIESPKGLIAIRTVSYRTISQTLHQQYALKSWSQLHARFWLIMSAAPQDQGAAALSLRRRYSPSDH